VAIKKATTLDDIKESKTEPEAGSVRVVSPMGAHTTVPESIVDALVESGYTVKK
jgi:hypothetical protein